MGVVHFIPDELYATIEASIPIACADFILVRSVDGHVAQVGLIERHSPYGTVWCHLGGRIRHGETIAKALTRHLEDSLSGAVVEIGDDPQPVHTYQWFPAEVAPTTSLQFGLDDRKHAIGLSYVLEETGQPRPATGEALDFRYFPVDDLPTRMWPGSATLVAKLLQAHASH